MARNHFHIPIPHPSTVAHNLPHLHRSSNTSSSSSAPAQHISKAQTMPNITAHPHVDTPHPHENPNGPVSYLDAHVPPFAKHHHEFQVQHYFRDAKREARRTSGGTKIPDYILEAQEPEEQHVRTSEEIARDQAEWEAVVKAREAARRRVTIDLIETERMNGETKMETVVMMGRVNTAMTATSEAMRD